jgi:hypothetical protein
MKKTLLALSTQYNYSIEVLEIMFPNYEMIGQSDDVVVFDQLKTYMAIMSITNDSCHLFNIIDSLKQTFAHSDCYMLAEYMLYLFHDNENITVSYVHLWRGISLHGLVEVTYKGEIYYIDAIGIYKDLNDILARYELSANDIEINFYTGDDVIGDGNSAHIRKLSELTNTNEIIYSSIDSLQLDCSGDIEEYAVCNIMKSIVFSEL